MKRYSKMKNLIILVSMFGLTCGLALEGDWREDQSLRENFADFIYNRLIFFKKLNFIDDFNKDLNRNST